MCVCVYCLLTSVTQLEKRKRKKFLQLSSSTTNDVREKKRIKTNNNSDSMNNELCWKMFKKNKHTHTHQQQQQQSSSNSDDWQKRSIIICIQKQYPKKKYSGHSTLRTKTKNVSISSWNFINFINHNDLSIYLTASQKKKSSSSVGSTFFIFFCSLHWKRSRILKLKKKNKFFIFWCQVQIIVIRIFKYTHYSILKCLSREI